MCTYLLVALGQGEVVLASGDLDVLRLGGAAAVGSGDDASLEKLKSSVTHGVHLSKTWLR